MAIISFALTAKEFLQGRKTVTRRDWSDEHFNLWVNLWDSGRIVHDAWDNLPRAGGKKIGKFMLTKRPYKERLDQMPTTDLREEGGMCSTLEEYHSFIGKNPRDYVTVIRFRKM